MRATISRAIRSTCAGVSDANVTISSIRLRNSGRNAALAAASIRSSSGAGSRGGEAERALGLARAEVRRHHDHRVGEVDRAALAVGQPAVVHELQQDVPDLRVGLLDLVEQDHGVRAPAHRLGQLAAVAVADVAGRRADQPRDRVRLAELGHVDPDERLLGREQPLRSALTSSVLPTPVGPRNRNVPERPVALRQADAGAADGVGDRPRRPRPGRRRGACRSSSSSCRRSSSPATSSPTGMPVRAATTAATSVSPTTGAARRRPRRPASRARSRRAARLDPAGVLVGLGVDRGLLLGRSCSSSAAAGGRRRPARRRRTLGGGLVDQVDRLVGQAVLGDVAVAQPRRGDERLVGRSSRRGASS